MVFKWRKSNPFLWKSDVRLRLLHARLRVFFSSAFLARVCLRHNAGRPNFGWSQRWRAKGPQTSQPWVTVREWIKPCRSDATCLALSGLVHLIVRRSQGVALGWLVFAPLARGRIRRSGHTLNAPSSRQMPDISANVGSLPVNVGGQLSTVGCLLLNVGAQFSIIGRLPLSVGALLSRAGCLLLNVGGQLSIVGRLLAITGGHLSTFGRLLRACGGQNETVGRLLSALSSENPTRYPVVPSCAWESILGRSGPLPLVPNLRFGTHPSAKLRFAGRGCSAGGSRLRAHPQSAPSVRSPAPLPCALLSTACERGAKSFADDVAEDSLGTSIVGDTVGGL